MPRNFALRVLFAVFVLSALPALGADSGHKVILLLIDGLRWQDVMRGADPTLMNKENGGVQDVNSLAKRFWREDPIERRAALMPFLWNVVARQGQVYGNRDVNSAMRVENTFHFSYPGYSEMIVGYADPRIDTNQPLPNPNVSVFEWLNTLNPYKNKVAVFGAWDVVRAIVNPVRSKLRVNVGVDPVDFGKMTATQQLLNKLKKDVPAPWGTEPYDALTFYSALEYIKADKPRAVWITFGETDEFAHAGRYDQYLDAAYRTDNMLRTLWETLQSMPEYKDKTTLIFSVDHGRGFGLKDWTGHGASIPGADQTWLAILGPRTKPLGVRRNIPEVTTSMIAATVAASLGENWNNQEPKAARPIPDAVEEAAK